MRGRLGIFARSSVAGLLLCSFGAGAQQAPGNQPAPQPAAGIEVSASTDSDHTDVLKVLGRALWSFEGSDKYQGLAFEHGWFRPQGQRTREQTRIYVDLADRAGDRWRWQARVGYNGHTILGSASVRRSDWSKEFFVEREVVETPRGLDQGIYYTFVGGSADLPAGPKDVFNLMVGAQKFTGDNVRLHLRGTYVRVLKPELGLSVQLRARYYHSTVPGEFDYFSPRNFVQLLPVVQMRRFDRSGWMYLGALGYGVQKPTGNKWQGSRFADFRVQSPARSHRLQAFAEVQYSNNSLTGASAGYHYVLGRLGVTMRLD